MANQEKETKQTKANQKIEVVFIRGAACAPFWMAYGEGDRAKIDADKARELIKAKIAMTAKGWEQAQKAKEEESKEK